MPRRPRLVIAGIALHATQRGVNRAADCQDHTDYRVYLELLADVVESGAVTVHAYALMSNHVHLFITPRSASDLAHSMRMLNQRYVASFNRRHGRTVTLWESRFRSCLVDTQRYAMTLYRYIELNPVRASTAARITLRRCSSAKRPGFMHGCDFPAYGMPIGAEFRLSGREAQAAEPHHAAACCSACLRDT